MATNVYAKIVSISSILTKSEGFWISDNEKKKKKNTLGPFQVQNEKADNVQCSKSESRVKCAAWHHNRKTNWWQVTGRDSRKSRKHGNRDFRQMPWFCQNTVFAMFFGQNTVLLHFYSNILFLISVSWSLLCDFNTKIFYLCFCYQSQCALLPWRHRKNMYFTFFWS